MTWISVKDRLPEDGFYVMIAYDFGIGIGRFIDGDWDSVGSNRKHFIFTNTKKLYSSCSPLYWAPLPESPKD